LNDGTRKTFEPGMSYTIPPGHDAWVEGNERFVCIEVMSTYHDDGTPQRVSVFVSKNSNFSIKNIWRGMGRLRDFLCLSGIIRRAVSGSRSLHRASGRVI
jgi:hypothetical protein